MNRISRIFCEFLILMIIRQHSSKIEEAIREIYKNNLEEMRE